MVLQAIALHTQGEKAKALKFLDELLTLAEPGGFIRLFADEGIPMVRLLSEAAEHSIQPDYIARLLVVLNAEFQTSADMPGIPNSSPVQLAIESLSQRELEILRLVAHGLSNHEICNQLFLALDTVKGHNRRIFEKLHVNRRTEAVACARKLGLI
jgi:LuxR family maltose regulon positive regulatory protein